MIKVVIRVEYYLSLCLLWLGIAILIIVFANKDFQVVDNEKRWCMILFIVMALQFTSVVIDVLTERKRGIDDENN